MHIPLTKPYWGKEEEKVLRDVLKRSHGSGDGPYTKQLIAALKNLTGSTYVIPVTSCTHGLELAMIALDIGPGDEVIMPSFTMSSTANSVVLRGATPVFADIDPVTFCIDPKDIEKRINKKTRGIIVVHYAGMACDMEAIAKIAKKHNLFIVEDAAHAIGATYKGKPLGTLGDIGVYSFHGTKNISCGEGGVALTNNTKLVETMEIYRSNGTNRAAFLAGIVDKYSWVGVGSSYFLSDILASIVTVQLKKLSQINKKRNQIATLYTKALARYNTIVTLPTVSEGTSPNWHIYAIVFHKKNHRDIFLHTMRAKGIDVAYHYVPLHSSEMGRKLYRVAEVASKNFSPGFSFPRGVESFSSMITSSRSQSESGKNFSSSPQHSRLLQNLPVTESVWERLVRLPIYPGLSKEELTYILTSAQRVLCTLH